MAYMDRNTFEILHSSDELDIKYIFAGHYHVDELIALPVQVLNRKGYRTSSCCSGHPYKEYMLNFVYATMIDEELADKEPPIKFSHIEEFKKSINSGGTEQYKDKVILLPRVSYVVFEQDITVPFAPDGFVMYESRPPAVPRMVVVEKFYDSEIPVYDYFAEIVDAMRKLHEWALSLEPYKGDN